MCGIYARVDTARLETPIPCPPIHRGPDAAGVEHFECCGAHVTLAHWRLSILDPRPDANQPYSIEKDGPRIVFNGEIYNYVELRGELGGTWRTTSDTEVLLQAWEKWGEGCLPRLRGMFAFVVFDPRKKVVFAARDRFGIKPLYFRRDGARWEFASEIKQLLPAKRLVNPLRARDFLSYGAMDHTRETLFAGVEQLRGGQSLKLSLEDLQSPEICDWYRIGDASGARNGCAEETARHYREKFFETIRLHLRSDVPLGFCLSGGMDSSAIIAAASALQRSEGRGRVAIHCRYRAEGLDESRFARDAAALSRSRLCVIEPAPDEALAVIEKVTWHQDEPLDNASILSQYLVFAESRSQGLKVMLDGQGGDEQLASYPAFAAPYILRKLLRLEWVSGKIAMEHFRKEFGMGIGGILKAALAFLAPRAFRRFLCRLRGPGPWSGMLHKDFLDAGGGLCAPWGLEKSRAPVLSTRRLSEIMLLHFSLPMLLHWEDRNSMAHSIEARVPFVDHELIEWTLALPDEFKIRDGETKWILRRALRDLLPPSVLQRRDKKGFATPEAAWLRRDQDGFFSKLIREAPARFPGIFLEKGLLQTWESFRAGGGKSSFLWRTAAMSLWARVFEVGGGD